jgi:hypothetical protein
MFCCLGWVSSEDRRLELSPLLLLPVPAYPHSARANTSTGTPLVLLSSPTVLRIRNGYPGGDPNFIHPGSNNSVRRGGGENFVVLPFFVATNII